MTPAQKVSRMRQNFCPSFIFYSLTALVGEFFRESVTLPCVRSRKGDRAADRSIGGL
jgi:hypothetical protein